MLIAAAEREQEPVQADGLLPHALRRLFHDVGQLFPLAPRVKHRQRVFLLIGRDAGRRLHPLGKQPQQLVVDFVNACSVLG